MDRALLLLCALLLNTVFGGTAAFMLRHWLRMPARLIRDIERKLNREHRSDEDLKMRGTVLAALSIFVSMVAGGVCAWLFHHNLRFIELAVLALALPVRPAWNLAARIRHKLYALDVVGAKEALADTPWRHHALLDEYGVARAAIETLAVTFSEKILAPACWYLLFGLPGLFISKSIYLLQETLARPGETSAFGRPAKIAHSWLHAVPVRIAAFFWMIVSAILPSTKFSTIQPILKGMGKSSPHVISLLSSASVLKLSLGGPMSIYAQEWTGAGTPKASAYDIKRG